MSNNITPAKELYSEKLKAQQARFKFEEEYRQRTRERWKHEDDERARTAYKSTTLYRAGADIAANTKSSSHGDFTAIALSAMSGGILNPEVAKALKLDIFAKGLAKSGANLVGRTIGNGIANSSRATKNSDGGGTSKRSASEEIRKKSKNVTDGAIANDKNVDAKILNQVTQINGKVKGKSDKAKVTENKEEESFFGKLLGFLTGPGMLAVGGLAAAALPILVDKVFPSIKEKFDNGIQGFFEETVGMSAENAGGVTDLVKNALPAAILGATFGGWKGALIGAGISMAYDMITGLSENIKNSMEGKSDESSSILGIPTPVFQGAIIGAGIGGTVMGLKGAAIGGVLGAGGALLAVGYGKFKKHMKDWDNDSIRNQSIAGIPVSILEMMITGAAIGSSGGLIGMGIGALVGAISGAVYQYLPKIKAFLSKAANMAAHPVETIKAMVSGDWSYFEDAAKKEQLAAKTEKRLQKEAQYAKEADFFSSSDYLNLHTDHGRHRLTTSQRRVFLEKFGYLPEEELRKPSSRKLTAEEAARVDELIDGTVSGKKDKDGGGYGSTSSLTPGDGNIMVHGRPAVSLKELGLNGEVVSSNSVPYIAEGNSDSLKTLDSALNSWGYDVVYTSAMGGHKAGTGHWKGNKVDLQLKRNGKSAHLNYMQLLALRKAGYWGSGTGALGWEPVRGQVGGGHYDLYLGNAGGIGSVNEVQYANAGISGSNSYGLNTQSMNTTVEENAMTMTAMNDNLSSVNANTSKKSEGSNYFADVGNVAGVTSSSTTSSQAAPMSMASNTASGFAGSGGSGSNEDITIYAWGDVAKTAILYTI